MGYGGLSTTLERWGKLDETKVDVDDFYLKSHRIFIDSQKPWFSGRSTHHFDHGMGVLNMGNGKVSRGYLRLALE